MIILPAIDLQGGHVVQLVGGDPDAVAIERREPAQEVAQQWLDQGAKWLHVVDLDRALSKRSGMQPEVRAVLKQAHVPVQVGGGLRDEAAVHEMLDAGAKRAIVGTRAVLEPAWLSRLAEDVGPERLVLAVDGYKGRVRTHGWQQDTGLRAVDVARHASSLGLGAVLYTDTSVEGRMAGPDFPTTEHLLGLGIPIIASGGIATRDHLETLAEIGCWGAVLGVALYNGRIGFEATVP